MRSPTSFHLFPQLPPELQDLIWKCHRERRGIRHYFVKSGDSCRHYAAIDIETGLFANTFLTKRHIKTYWDDDCRPIKGETDYKIRLTGSRYVSEPGDFAKSVTTSKYAKTWSRKTRPS